ncbi:galactose oxidase [Lichtheimia corymbifera JMRC:FSU:9682]|uniref:Galactose oxidase n=1 Tax=Lichtheimia corymbifera JMRC:FSU:9682 TaxID=1263082 RepID=A0A068RJC9_9FUNG|nr:galactose oxidase [Lichtheimia corymbifera JMRC:FSU:9682]
MAPAAAAIPLSSSTSTSAPSSSKSIADLTTRLASAKGDVPPPLIGASTTLVDNRVYVFGGRLTASAHVHSQLYVLDLSNGVWTHVVPKHQQQKQPAARYFHSATAINNHCIVFFGGLTISVSNGGELRSLGDLFILHISDDSEQLHWEFPTLTNDITIAPHPRHSHLAMTANHDNHLVILGGQDVNSGYIDEINVYDCRKKTWYPRIATQSHYTSYETAAAALLPVSASASAAMGSPNFLKVFSGSHHSGQQDDTTEDGGGGETQQQRQTWGMTTTLFAYSNENIHGVHRRLHRITVSASGHVESITDHTSALSTSRQYAPPALRAMGSAACGQFLIMFGACTTSEPHHLQIWALNISTMMWTKIDAGPRLVHGSWLCGVFREHADRNELIVFGHPESALHEDHTQRVVHYDYWVTIDTEAFGVYNPPYLTCGTFAQDAGLALLNNPALSDLTILTTDGQRARANSTILAQRWSSIRHHLEPLLSPSTSSPAFEVYTSSQHQQALPGYILTFPETYDILIAFLQFIYTDHLTTVEQNQPRILTRLLILADLFDIARLKSLASHALHQMLQISTAPSIYQTAALANCWSLQVRALRIMVNAKKLMQQQQQQQQQHPPSPTAVKVQSSSYALNSRPSSPSTQPMDDPFKHFGAASLIAATGSSTSYQPLSKLLRQYDLDAPLPPVNPLVSDPTTQQSQAPPPSTASSSSPQPAQQPSPPPVQAKNPARKRENSASSAVPTIKKNYRNAPVWLPMSF